MKNYKKKELLKYGNNKKPTKYWFIKKYNVHTKEILKLNLKKLLHAVSSTEQKI